VKGVFGTAFVRKFAARQFVVGREVSLDGRELQLADAEDLVFIRREFVDDGRGGNEILGEADGRIKLERLFGHGHPDAAGHLRAARPAIEGDVLDKLDGDGELQRTARNAGVVIAGLLDGQYEIAQADFAIRAKAGALLEFFVDLDVTRLDGDAFARADKVMRGEEAKHVLLNEGP